MIRAIRSHISWKIFLTYLLVILVGGVVLVETMNLYFPPALDRHLQHMSPLMQQTMGIPRPPGFLQYFRSAIDESLIYSALAAFGIALLASLILSRRLTTPVKSIMQASQRIAEGDYSHRVSISARQDHKFRDELDQLAISFNQMAERLQQIEEIRRQLIADVSHELRTPLTTIKGSMEGLMDGVLPANPETYQSVYREADRLQGLVEDLHELSRVESGKIALNLKSVNITHLIHTAQKQMQSAFDEKHITLNDEIQKNLVRVKADEDRILQVLINLLGNAMQFTPPDGSVTISAKRQEKNVLVSVKDTGIGIQPHDLPHIFERFYRADKSRSRQEGGGSGIGLTIAQSLVYAHGGRIWAESEGEGRGSTFSFTLPII